ncbi:MAG: prevent-host-death protein [Opitutaceae bacterium]|jgi:antitoxin (DNA-binding transcriptional repressor) of toxin-antitoxin stability system|nr:prevent-host-death protein [Opitutaceae bacterium]
MRTATVADLRNHFTRVSQWIEGGESVTITRRGQSFATLKPAARKKKKVEWPDLMARLDRRFPDGPPPGKPLSEIVDEGRGEY